MSDASDRRNLEYVLHSIELIRARTASGRSTFVDDVDVQDAVLWRLQTLAEATSKLSDALRERHPSINWRAIHGFRNVVAHWYLKLRLGLVWEIIEVHLAHLYEVTKAELERLSPE